MFIQPYIRAVEWWLHSLSTLDSQGGHCNTTCSECACSVFPLSLAEPLLMPVRAQSTRTTHHWSVWAALLLWRDPGTQLVVHPWVQWVYTLLLVFICTEGGFTVSPYCGLVPSPLRCPLHQLPRGRGTDCTRFWHRSLGYDQCCHFLPFPWLQSQHKRPVFVVCLSSNGCNCRVLVPLLLGAQLASPTLSRGVIHTWAMVCVHALEGRTVVARGCVVKGCVLIWYCTPLANIAVVEFSLCCCKEYRSLTHWVVHIAFTLWSLAT